MSSAQPKPAWLTDELADVEEWIDWQDEDQSLGPDQSGSELSFTQPLGSVLVRNSDLGSSAGTASTDDTGGTFIVREEVPPVPLLPKTPGRNKKPVVKDFFSPLALEKMFEPPSPPQQAAPLPSGSRATAIPVVPSRLSQVHVPSPVPTITEEGEEDRPVSAATVSVHDQEGLRVEGPQSQFTFSAPRSSPFNPAGPIPDAQSTPGPGNATRYLNPPPTDPRLRLFQFQYDTFTRDHLSAMVDSIAVNTPSGDGGPTNPSSRRTTPSGLSPVEESSFTRLRSAKRVKLSPASDFSGDKGNGDGAAIIMRPVSRRDYVGESKNLMDQIRQARDFSTVSTVATSRSPAAEPVQTPEEIVKEQPPLRKPSFLAVPDDGSSRDPSPNGTTSSRRSGYSSLGYRQQAASLMAQIRNDMKGSKRLFSGDTEASHLRNDDATEASSIISANTTVPSLRSRGGDTNTLTQLRKVSEAHSQGRRVSTVVHNRVSSVTRGKQRAGQSPRSSPRKPSTARHMHSARPSEDLTRELSEDMTRMSIGETSRMLSQFPVPPTSSSFPPPVRLVSASPSTAPRSPVKESPGHLAPPTVPAYPSSSVRAGRNEDLTRFVSSSTASGTTLTAGSAASFVKHAGPKQLTQITPQDIGALPERVGKMVFDRVMMRWVKATALATAGLSEAEVRTRVGSGVGARAAMGVGPNPDAELDNDNDSEDPFRDIESLREDESDERGAIGEGPALDEGASMTLEKSRIEEVSEEELEDEEEAELTSFSTDGPSQDFTQDVDIDEEDEVETSYTESDISHDREGHTGSTVPTATLDLPLGRPAVGVGIEDEATAEPAFEDTPPRFIAAAPGPRSFSAATPNPSSQVNGGTSSGVTNTPLPRPALKSTSATPLSALKDPSRGRIHTPANKSGHRRSVSFSDGKRDGPIVGIGRNIPTRDGSAIGDEYSPLASGSRASDKSSAVLVPSARSKRIADMLGHLEDSDPDGDSPSKTSMSSRPSADGLARLQPRRPSIGPGALSSGSAPRQVSRRVSTASRSTPNLSSAAGNATFLTECSFGVAHDRLVQVITDVQPFEPYWEELTSIDLSHRNLDSTARLKEFLPRLDSLSLNSNQLSWLSGVPGTVRTLSVASNLLTGVTSFSHLLNLENLDISRNEIDSLRQLECLRHLRELRADGNRIDSVDGLQKMDGLIKLSLQGNIIRSLDLHDFKWTRLEMLNVSQNRISSISGLGSAPSLVALNLDDNLLGGFEPEVSMPRLRILRLSSNRLNSLTAVPFPNLRTLYADNDALGTIVKAYRLGKLENLSVRNQSGRAGLTLSIRDVRDVKRLYLSGNPLKAGFLSEPCYNLVYLELAACRLMKLPQDFARMVPNVRVLNLNYNFLEDAGPLEGLGRLRKLTIIGSRIKGAKQLIRIVRGMHDLEMIDFRMNPCTLGWYLPLLVKDIPGALQPSDGDRAPVESAPVAGGRANETNVLSTSREDKKRPRSDSTSDIGPATAVRGSSPPGPHADNPDSDSSGGGGSGGELRPWRERSQSELAWRELDAKFRRDLPDEAYVGRLAYRGLVMRACPKIVMLDGIHVERKERDKAERLLRSIFGAGKAKDAGLSGVGIELEGGRS
ncbi:hypothetical protein BD311DRAFT_669517 [Dichomitus squalens]|uniref:L domain-like protein n=1 Tax=Dichomitus squalens TaxID=114155 RepID=A0A4Q9MDS8_9APHY|nr:hypothetical protein BD311DRAFT_669517 [Dichomitus squalens]